MDKRRWDLIIPIITMVLLVIMIVIALAKDANEKLNEKPGATTEVATVNDADVATASEATPEDAKEEPEPTKEVVHCITTETTTQATTTEEITTEVFSVISTEATTEVCTEEITEEWTEEQTAEEYYEEPSPPEEPQEPEPPAEPTAPEGMTYLGSYWITGYTATGSACANGNYPSSGYTAACNSLPMGTVVYIEGIGTRVIEDRGGMASNVIDVFVDSTSDAYAITGTYDVYIVE